MFDNNNQDQPTSQITPSGSTSRVVTPPEPSATLDSGQAETTAPSTNPVGMPGNLTTPEPTVDESAAPASPTTAPVASGVAGEPVADDLLALKQSALQQLSPLVSHLDQTPEERFRTTMMMIQATDDSSKIKEAYEAAQAITDEKTRAQALLDVVNEINYFTQQQDEQTK